MPTTSKKLTIFDVARLAQVSATTVSRVINNGKVGKEVKERVSKIIEKYKYHPDPHAQYLAHKRKVVDRLCPDYIRSTTL
jgi:DNA-binding LacI/PurR family transcriptional regulator